MRAKQSSNDCTEQGPTMKKLKESVRRGLDLSRGSEVREGTSLLAYLSLLGFSGVAVALLARWLLQA
jgi:type III secretory pathway component EscU